MINTIHVNLFSRARKAIPGCVNSPVRVTLIPKIRDKLSQRFIRANKHGKIYLRDGS